MQGDRVSKVVRIILFSRNITGSLPEGFTGFHNFIISPLAVRSSIRFRWFESLRLNILMYVLSTSPTVVNCYQSLESVPISQSDILSLRSVLYGYVYVSIKCIYVYIVCKINVCNLNCAQATALIFDSRMDVIV